MESRLTHKVSKEVEPSGVFNLEIVDEWEDSRGEPVQVLANKRSAPEEEIGEVKRFRSLNKLAKSPDSPIPSEMSNMSAQEFPTSSGSTQEPRTVPGKPPKPKVTFKDPETMDQDKKERFSVKPGISLFARSMDQFIKESYAQPFVNLSLAEALTFLPEFRQQVQAAGSTRSKEAIREAKNSKSSAFVHVNQLSKTEEVMRQPTPTVPGTIDGQSVSFTLDNGSELDLISLDFLDVLNREPDRPSKFWMKSANGQVDPMAGIVEGLELDIHGIKHRHDFFVAKRATYDVLLGAPWIKRMNATCIWDGNGIKQFCTISAEDREKHVKFVVARENPDPPYMYPSHVHMVRVFLQEEPVPPTQEAS